MRTYSELAARLRTLGFTEDSEEGAPICRFGRRHGGIKLDVMPTDPSILGFSNRWFPLAFQTAEAHRLPGGREIKAATAPCFLGTKLEAFMSRGEGDFLASKDIEDLVAVVHGRESIVTEVGRAEQELRLYLAEKARILLRDQAFLGSVEGHLPGEDPALLADRLRRIAAVDR